MVWTETMTGKKLDLLQLAASGAAKPSATSAEVKGRELADPNLTGERLDDMPDQLFRYGFRPKLCQRCSRGGKRCPR